MTDTVTVYSCGTGASRLDNYTIPFTWGLTQGRSWINDGPGSSHAPSRAEAILKKVESGKGVGDKLFDKRHKDGGLSGLALGKGTQDNIVVSIQWLWEEFYSSPFRTINLAGWSRGAVTSIMLAHAIQEAGFGAKGVRVNVFAFDPVPGLANDFDKGDFDKTGRVGDPRSLPAIVRHYDGVVMENINGMLGLKPYMFKSVSPEATGRGTLGREFPLPGSHSDCVKHDDPENPVGQIGVHLLHSFLTRHGTSLEWHKMQSAKEVLEQYARARLKHSRSDGKGGLLKRGAQRVRKRIVQNDFREHRFFVNGHHFAVMHDVMPRVLDHLHDGKRFPQALDAELKMHFPHTHKALVASGVMKGSH